MTMSITRMADGVTLAELLDRERRHDEIVRHTSVGPHRDDLELTLDGMELSNMSSRRSSGRMPVALPRNSYWARRRAMVNVLHWP